MDALSIRTLVSVFYSSPCPQFHHLPAHTRDSSLRTGYFVSAHFPVVRDTDIQLKRPLQRHFAGVWRGRRRFPRVLPPLSRGKPISVVQRRFSGFRGKWPGQAVDSPFFLICGCLAEIEAHPIERLPGVERTICSMRQLQRALLVPTSDVLVGANRPGEVECGNESGNDCDFPPSQTLLNVA